MNMTEASAGVFPFPKNTHYPFVIKYLAAEGPVNGPTLRKHSNKMVKKKEKLERDAFREGILRGTKNVPGLVKKDYIFEKPSRGRFDKDEYLYYLKPKGIIASLQFKKIQENHFFKELCKSIDNKTSGEIFPDLVRDFLSSQIELFLAYHYLQGIQLTWQTNFDTYYWNFFNYLDRGFGIIVEDYNKKKMLQQVVEDFIVNYSKVIYLTVKINGRSERFPCVFDFKLDPVKNFDRKNWYYNLINWTHSYGGIILDSKERIKVKQIPRIQSFHTYWDWGHLYNRVYYDLKRKGVRMQWAPK